MIFPTHSCREDNKTKNHHLYATILTVLFLTACSSLLPAIDLQTAVAATQAVLPTQTAYPTYTPFPTSTPFPTYTPFPPTPYPTKIPYIESFSIRLFPGTVEGMVYSIETGTEIWLDFPKDAVLEPSRVMLIPGLASIYPDTLIFNGDAFSLLAGLGDQMEGFKRFTFNAPVSVTIKFAAAQDLETLALYTWTGSEWEKVETVCNLPLPSLDASTNTIKTSICSPGAFAIFTQQGE
jgi:hypothetical protein